MSNPEVAALNDLVSMLHEHDGTRVKASPAEKKVAARQPKVEEDAPYDTDERLAKILRDK